MRLTIILSTGERWRIPVKDASADVRWIIDEVTKRRVRRNDPQTDDPISSAPTRDITGLRRPNSAILELDDILMDSCNDGGLFLEFFFVEKIGQSKTIFFR
jgi:hypothetical protein